MHLTLWQSIQNNIEETQAHRRGLLQMVKIKGWDQLGFDGLLAYLITT